MLALLTALYLWGWLRIGLSGPQAPLGRGRKVLAWLFAALAAWLVWGCSGARLNGTVDALLPPPATIVARPPRPTQVADRLMTRPSARPPAAGSGCSSTSPV